MSHINTPFLWGSDMTFKTRMLLFISALTLNSAVWGSEVKSDNVIDFTLTPLTCIVAARGDDCELLIDLSWALYQQQDVCLWQDDKQLICWQQQTRNRQKLPVKLTQTTQFLLKDMETGRLLAEQSVEMKFHHLSIIAGDCDLAGVFFKHDP